MEFVDDIEPLETDWAHWAEEHDPQPVWVSELHLADGARRIGGVFVTPPRQVMGIRAWADALEGVRGGAPWVLFDVEKIVRMAIHQSGLAFELLTSPRAWTDTAGFPAREIAAAAFHRGVINYFRDVAEPLGVTTSDRWRWRSLLTGWTLATSGEVTHDLRLLVERTDDDRLAPVLEGPLSDADAAHEYIDEMLAGADALGDSPPDYDWLDQFVFDSRMERA